MRTCTCLIIDDEDLIVQRLELFFQELAGRDGRFRLIGKAYSGTKGIEEALRLKPDIIISDIVMPQMDGISMIEELKPKLPNTQYILLSAYSSFDYAQRAIRANILEYIVKVPLREADLERALDKAAGTLEEIRKKEDEFQSLNVTVLENKYRIRKQFFNELVRGEISSYRVSDFGNWMQVHYFQSWYCCFIVEINHYESFRNEYSAVDQSILKYAMTNVIEETLVGFGAGVASELHDDRFIGFFAWDHNRSEMDTQLACLTLGRQIVNHLMQYLNQEASVAFGSPHRGLESIKQAYSQAADISEDFYFHEEKTVKTPAHRIRYQNVPGPALQQKLTDFLAWMHRGISRQELEEQMEALYRYVIEGKIHKSVTAPLMRDLYRDVASKLKAWHVLEPGDEEFPIQFMTFREQLRLIGDFIFEHLQDGQLSQRTEIIRAKRLIEGNVKQRLTLQAIADHVNLAPAYFSSLFKKTMKEGVVEYINRRKIELSLELLQVKDYSNFELCEEVGVVNEGYFCKLFKQYTGFTPKQYRKKIQGLK
ncbi:response regulator [Paenibacillus sp. LHD-117]|uniref:response regulator n=1 Tax=Paenibacillus sp. LHD-117 TaxID=3071412 RepID=UPI0027E0FE3C|nr:response regulator [Paenibacillus sp. LHD-117]MDQ6418434.1 response regulator [Paenibacillus sp. LHD-117]